LGYITPHICQNIIPHISKLLLSYPCLKTLPEVV
jgi:hypothetical protein